MQPKVRTAEIVKQFNLHIVTGEEGLHRPILTADLCRPGLVLAGYYAYYPAERLQILGKTELTFFNNLTYEEQRERANVLCTDETPGILITRGFEVPEAIIQAADETRFSSERHRS